MPWKQKGPLSLSGATHAPVAQVEGACWLRVLDHSGPGDEACVSPDEPALADWDWSEGGVVFLQLASGSDCVLRATPRAGVARGTLLLDAVQRHNMHVETHESYTFAVHEPLRAELCEVELDARLLSREQADSGDSDALNMHRGTQVEAQDVSEALFAHRTQHMLAVGEVVVLDVGGLDVRLRVSRTDVLSQDAREDAVGYHCFRGLLTPATRVYLRPQQQGGLELLRCPVRPELPPSANTVTVHTNDGEFFLVNKRVLRPCISLTRAIRSAGPGGGSEASVDVGCLVFDRVLVFLEALAVNGPPPEFAMSFLDDLAAAARVLGLRTLGDMCAERQGAFSSRLREWALDEVVQRNGSGGCLLMLDGMVLDVANWLPEHPGGSTIIPSQSLNLDCARFFELYHSSRESFIYLRHFYVGEICGEDRDAVPSPVPPPSPEFLKQLQEFTSSFRIAVRGSTHKSF